MDDVGKKTMKQPATVEDLAFCLNFAVAYARNVSRDPHQNLIRGALREAMEANTDQHRRAMIQYVQDRLPKLPEDTVSQIAKEAPRRS